MDPTASNTQKNLPLLPLRWKIGRLERERIIYFITVLAFLLGAALPWYHLPAEAMAAFGARLWSEPLERMIAAAGAMVALVALSGRRACPGPWVRTSLWLVLVSVASFPYTLCAWSPPVSLLAASLSEQEARIAWHIDRTLPFVQAQWKQNISLDPPRPTPSLLGPAIADARFFSTTALGPLLTDALGYRAGLLRFAGRGWHLAFLASAVALFGVYLAGGLGVFVLDVQRLAPVLLLAVATAVLPMVYVNFANRKLEAAVAEGNYPLIVSESVLLRKVFPLLDGDERFLVRLAEAQERLGGQDPALRDFALGLGLYRQKHYQQAIPCFAAALTRQPDFFLARHYLATTLTMQGLLDFNRRMAGTRLSAQAARAFEQALAVYPGNIEAMYDLMIARAVNADHGGAATLARRIIAQESQSVEQPNLSLIAQAHVHLAWERYRSGDLATAWQRFRQAHDDALWRVEVDGGHWP